MSCEACTGCVSPYAWEHHFSAFGDHDLLSARRFNPEEQGCHGPVLSTPDEAHMVSAWTEAWKDPRSKEGARFVFTHVLHWQYWHKTEILLMLALLKRPEEAARRFGCGLEARRSRPLQDAWG
jgi:hypothetical protein